MSWQRFRLAALMAVSLAVTALPAHAYQEGDDAKANGNDKGNNNAAAAPAAPAGNGCGGCGPSYRVECVPETYKCKRVTYRTEQRQVTCTAYRTECVPVTRTRCVTTYCQVPETRNVEVCVPCYETRTVMRPHWTTQNVCETRTRVVDRGHWECREVPVGPSCFERLGLGRGGHGHRGGGDCCEPCPPCPRTKTVKCWVPCKVCEQYQVTCCKRVCEMRPCQTQVCVMKRECKQVTCYRCVPQTRNETYTCNVTRCVPYQTTRTVCVCVPCEEWVTATRYVARMVPCAPAPAAAPCNDTCGQATACCCEGGKPRHGGRLGGLFRRGGRHGRGGDCCN
jgi:hypothetical protein